VFGRCLGCLVLAAAVAAIGAGEAAPFASGTRGAGTAMHIYEPFKGRGLAAGVRIGRTASGDCWTSSISSQRADAFRCTVGNSIYDPCFADNQRSSGYVLCLVSTPTSKVLRINLTKPLPPNPGEAHPTRYDPWAVQTSSGKWCTFIDGASSIVATMRINYACAGGGFLIGSLRRNSPTWTIFYSATFKATVYRPVGLVSAWWQLA